MNNYFIAFLVVIVILVLFFVIYVYNTRPIYFSLSKLIPTTAPIPTPTFTPIPTFALVPTYPPTTQYCTNLQYKTELQTYISQPNWSLSDKEKVVIILRNALDLSTEQYVLLNQLSNKQLLSLITIDCLLLKNDPNYFNLIQFTNWDTSYRNAAIFSIYDLLGGQKTDYTYSNHSILPFLQSLNNTQLFSFLV